MKFSLIWKIGIGTTVFSGGIATIVAITQTSKNNDEGQQNTDGSSTPTELTGTNKKEVETISIFVESNAILNNKNVINSNFEENYQCEFEKLKQKHKFDCTLYVPKLNKKLKHSNISEFIKNDEQQTSVNKQELQKTGNMYKVTVNKSFAETHKELLNKNTTFSVIPKTPAQGEEDKKFAWLNVLFAIDGQKLHENTIGNEFIFRADKSINSNGSGHYSCSIKDNSSVVDAVCYIYDFNKDQQTEDLDKLIFSKTTLNYGAGGIPTTPSTSIQNGKYYWMYFDFASNKVTLPKSNTIKKIIIKKDNNENEYDVTPSFYVYSKTKKECYLFVLN